MADESDHSAMNHSNVLRMSDEKTIELLELYRQEKCLWKTDLLDYRDKAKRIRSTTRIARKLNLPHFEPHHVLMKFKNLRNSYCQEMKKIVSSQNAGGPIYKPKVFWFNTMDSFLRPHLQPSRHYDKKILLSQEEIKKEPEDKEEWWVQLSNPDDVLDFESSLDSQPDQAEEYTNKQPQNPLSNLKRKLERNSTDKDDIARSLKEISQTIHNMKRQEDYFDSFGTYIGSLLRSLPRRNAMALQPKIVNLITKESAFYEEVGSQSDES